MRIRPAILALLSASLLPQPASANELTYYCDGFSQQHGGDQVAVTRSLKADGQQFDGSVIWSPKARRMGPANPRPDITLDLQITYALTPQNGIGTARSTALTLQIIDMPGPLANRNPETRRRNLAALKVEVSIDGRPPRQLSWEDAEQFTDWPLSTTRMGLISLAPSVRTLEFTVRDADGKVALTNRYDLDQTAGRDARFLIARGEADAAATDYMRCQKIG